MLKPFLSIAAFSLLLGAPLAAQDAGGIRRVGGTAPDAAYSPAVVVDDVIYVSGMLGVDAGPTIQDQTRRVMESIRDQLTGLGATMDDVVKCTVFMADLSERPQLNEVYRSFFPNGKPARSAVGVDLDGAKVEIDCIAVLPD